MSAPSAPPVDVSSLPQSTYESTGSPDPLMPSSTPSYGNEAVGYAEPAAPADVFEGETAADGTRVRGRLTYVNGDVYEGAFQDNKPHGQGELTYLRGATFVGQFEDGMRKSGHMKFKDGTTYDGEYENDVEHGEGTYTWGEAVRNKRGAIKFTGRVEYGQPVSGTEIYDDQWAWSEYKGSFYQDRWHGQGTLSFIFGKAGVEFKDVHDTLRVKGLDFLFQGEGDYFYSSAPATSTTTTTTTTTSAAPVAALPANPPPAAHLFPSMSSGISATGASFPHLAQNARAAPQSKVQLYWDAPPVLFTGEFYYGKFLRGELRSSDNVTYKGEFQKQMRDGPNAEIDFPPNYIHQGQRRISPAVVSAAGNATGSVSVTVRFNASPQAPGSPSAANAAAAAGTAGHANASLFAPKTPPSSADQLAARFRFFEGTCARDQMAKGRLEFDNGDVFTGDFFEGVPSYGKLVKANGIIYEGSLNFQQERSGRGKTTFTDGRIFDGSYIADVPLEGTLAFVAPHPLAGVLYKGQVNAQHQMHGNGKAAFNERTVTSVTHGAPYLPDGPPIENTSFSSSSSSSSSSPLSSSSSSATASPYHPPLIWDAPDARDGLQFWKEFTGVFESDRVKQGTMIYKDQSMYVGGFDSEGRKHGRGKWGVAQIQLGKLAPNADGSFDGVYENGVRVRGLCASANGDVYEGNFDAQWRRSGPGKLQRHDGYVFEGAFLANEAVHGLLEYPNTPPASTKIPTGTASLAAGGVAAVTTVEAPSEQEYNGPLAPGLVPHGIGRMKYRRGLAVSYDGAWANGKRNGYGELVLRSGGKVEGQFNDGVCSFGRLTTAVGDVYEGDLDLQLKFHGRGVLTFGPTSIALETIPINRGGYATTTANTPDRVSSTSSPSTPTSGAGAGAGAGASAGDDKSVRRRKFEGVFLNGRCARGVMTYSTGLKYHSEFIDPITGSILFFGLTGEAVPDAHASSSSSSSSSSSHDAEDGVMFGTTAATVSVNGRRVHSVYEVCRQTVLHANKLRRAPPVEAASVAALLGAEAKVGEVEEDDSQLRHRSIDLGVGSKALDSKFLKESDEVDFEGFELGLVILPDGTEYRHASAEGLCHMIAELEKDMNKEAEAAKAACETHLSQLSSDCWPRLQTPLRPELPVELCKELHEFHKNHKLNSFLTLIDTSRTLQSRIIATLTHCKNRLDNEAISEANAVKRFPEGRYTPPAPSQEEQVPMRTSLAAAVEKLKVLIDADEAVRSRIRARAGRLLRPATMSQLKLSRALYAAMQATVPTSEADLVNIENSVVTPDSASESKTPSTPTKSPTSSTSESSGPESPSSPTSPSSPSSASSSSSSSSGASHVEVDVTQLPHPDAYLSVLQPTVLQHEEVMLAMIRDSSQLKRATSSYAAVYAALNDVARRQTQISAALKNLSRAFVSRLILDKEASSNAASLKTFFKSSLDDTQGGLRQALTHAANSLVPLAQSYADAAQAYSRHKTWVESTYKPELVSSIQSNLALFEELNTELHKVHAEAIDIDKQESSPLVGTVDGWVGYRDITRRLAERTLRAKELHDAIAAGDVKSAIALLNETFDGDRVDVLWTNTRGADAIRLAIQSNQASVLNAILSIHDVSTWALRAPKLDGTLQSAPATPVYNPGFGTSTSASTTTSTSSTSTSGAAGAGVGVGADADAVAAAAAAAAVRLPTGAAATEAVLRRTNEMRETYLFDALVENKDDSQIDMAKALVVARADVHQPSDANGRTVMQIVAESGRAIRVKQLIALGYSLAYETPAQDGRASLHYACISNNIDCVKAVVEGGTTKVNWPDLKGDTPLHLTRDLSIATFLISNGARKGMKNRKGDKAVDVCGGSKDKAFMERAKTLEKNFNTRIPSTVPQASIVTEKSPRWAPDEQHPVCWGCQEAFSFFTRRHHCRLCGLVYCGSCSEREVYIKEEADVSRSSGRKPSSQRACDGCSNKEFLSPPPF